MPTSLCNYLCNFHGIVASRKQCHYASKIYDVENKQCYFGEQFGGKGLLRYLEEHKQDIIYCIWQAHCPDMDVPTFQWTFNIIFQENTLYGQKLTLI